MGHTHHHKSMPASSFHFSTLHHLSWSLQQKHDTVWPIGVIKKDASSEARLDVYRISHGRILFSWHYHSLHGATCSIRRSNGNFLLAQWHPDICLRRGIGYRWISNLRLGLMYTSLACCRGLTLILSFALHVSARASRSLSPSIKATCHLSAPEFASTDPQLSHSGALAAWQHLFTVSLAPPPTVEYKSLSFLPNLFLLLSFFLFTGHLSH